MPAAASGIAVKLTNPLFTKQLYKAAPFMPRYFRANPLHAALMVAFAIPLTALAQTTPSSADAASTVDTTASSTTTPPPKTKTLDTVKVTGSVIGNHYDVDSSSIGAKVPAALRDIPQSVVVVNRDLLDAQGATSF